ncbi:hypothetical protein F511_44428 [Dorcoceras hygrometricum]|uniref:Glycosyltransferase 61 catalytic domain-containing protein n=1 Tax=Dorcoceras hygrometricum TaxID=472368 RepID=A0A2Z6ZZ44_9LAMI|nr:hypothetical protein F511_44428 [Dorcoceras hygrometricum]
MAEQMGYVVEVLRPKKSTELAKIFRVLNSSDVMIGVHGAAMTHFLFMKRGSVFIHVIPLGTDWAADCEVWLELHWLQDHSKRELLVSQPPQKRPPKNDPVLTDPSRINDRGWEFTKKIYLDNQTVRLDLRRFLKRLLHAYYYTIAKKKGLSRWGSSRVLIPLCSAHELVVYVKPRNLLLYMNQITEKMKLIVLV